MSRAPSNPARRAVVRWAWRLFRREWRQQLMVLGLLTITVAASVAAATMTANAVSTSNGELGDATGLINVDGNDPAAVSATVEAARQRFGDVEVISHQHVAVPGLSRPLDLRGQDPDGLFSHPTLRLLAGRYPTGADEVALTDHAAALLGAGIGDTVDIGRVERTVVGSVENPDDLGDEFALVAAGQDDAADTFTVLVDADATGDGTQQADVPGQPHIEIQRFSTDSGATAAVLLVAITLAMALVCLIATAGFVVVAQRRQRQLGLLAAIGATERHLRLVMLANGALVGATAAVVGAVVGIAGWVIAAPAVEAAAGRRIDRFDLPWGVIVATLAIAVGMATLAAWWPARTMSRLPVITALSGRPSRPAAIHRSLALAGGLLGAGVVGIALADPTSDHVRPLVLVVGIVAVVLAVVLMAPGAIRALAAPAARLPFAPRLALRDLVRYQARAAAALAAVTLAIGISVAVVVLAQSSVAEGTQGNLSDRQILVSITTMEVSSGASERDAALDRLDAVVGDIAAATGSAAVYALDIPIHAPTPGAADQSEPVHVVRPIDNGYRGLGPAYVATPELLVRAGIDAAAAGDTTELITTLPGDVVLLDVAGLGTDRNPVTTVVRHVDGPTYSSAPTSLVTSYAMQQHGWVPRRAGWLVEADSPLTSTQIADARAAAAAAGLAIDVRDSQDDLARVRTIATTVGILLALAIVAMTIGLIRSESARDLRTLTATGASARTRRALTASTAGALALLGAVLGTAGAYVAIGAAFQSDLGRLVPVPVANLVAVVVGLPIVAAGAGWLLAGREPRRFARQALD